jgi:hypothetical protein
MAYISEMTFDVRSASSTPAVEFRSGPQRDERHLNENQLHVSLVQNELYDLESHLRPRVRKIIGRETERASERVADVIVADVVHATQFVLLWAPPW